MVKANKKVLIGAAILTALVFLSGLAVGWVLDSTRVAMLQSQISSLQNQFSSLSLENSFTSSLKDQSILCTVSLERSTQFSEEAGNLENTINNFQLTNQFQQNQITELKTQYTLVNLQFWLQMRNLRENCNQNITTILFFYNVRNCDACVAQGLVLDSVKKSNPSHIMIFAVDQGLDLGIISLLESTYNITTTPSIVINEKQIVQGFRNETFLNVLINVGSK